MFNFKRKHALLDTNILSSISKETKRAEAFLPVFKFLKDNDCEIFILNATKFEFVGYSQSKKDYLRLDKWLSPFTCVSVQKSDITKATELSAMYKNKNPSINPKQISFVDCLYATQLLKYKERAFIVTTDINDYPSFLFDMEKYMGIEENDGTTTFVGFKTYNEEKEKKLEDNFEKSA